MHSPCYSGHLNPQHTPWPGQRAHTVMHTCVPTILARGSAYLQLQDQVHPVLAEGTDVIEDEGCDDVNPIGLVGHDAALGEQCDVLAHRFCQSSHLHPPTQPRSKTVPCLITPVSLERAPFAPLYYLTPICITMLSSQAVAHNPCSIPVHPGILCCPCSAPVHTLKPKAGPVPAAFPHIPSPNPPLGIPDQR